MKAFALVAFGLLLNAGGVFLLLYGGIPVKSRETVVQVGGFKLEGESEKTAVPPPVGAAMIGLGTLMLAAPRGKK